MTNEEKALKLAVMIPEASVDDLLTFVDISEAIVLNRRYPFGYPDGTAVEPRYEMLQLQIAVEIYNRQGAEGEQSHSGERYQQKLRERLCVIELTEEDTFLMRGCLMRMLKRNRGRYGTQTYGSIPIWRRTSGEMRRAKRLRYSLNPFEYC